MRGTGTVPPAEHLAEGPNSGQRMLGPKLERLSSIGSVRGLA